MGSSPVVFKYFCSFFSISLFFVHNWIGLHLFEFGMRLCNKYSPVNNSNKPTCDLLLHPEYFFSLLLSSTVCRAHQGLPVGFLLLQYSLLFTVESLSLLYLLVIS